MASRRRRPRRVRTSATAKQPPDAATTMEVALGGGALEETTNPTNSNDLPALPDAAAPPPTNRAAAPPPRYSAAAPPPRNRAAATPPRSRAPRRSRTSVRSRKQEGHAGVAEARGPRWSPSPCGCYCGMGSLQPRGSGETIYVGCGQAVPPNLQFFFC